MSAADELADRLAAAQRRQADIRELRGWIERRTAKRIERGDLVDQVWDHDQAFLDTTQPILDWLEAEIAEVERELAHAKGAQ